MELIIDATEMISSFGGGCLSLLKTPEVLAFSDSFRGWHLRRDVIIQRN